MWACTRTSACLVSLRTVWVVVRVPRVVVVLTSRTYVRARVLLCNVNFLIGKEHTCALRTTWDTGQPAERRSECRATDTYTLATTLTPLPQRRGLPRESQPQYLRTAGITNTLPTPGQRVLVSTPGSGSRRAGGPGSPTRVPVLPKSLSFSTQRKSSGFASQR